METEPRFLTMDHIPRAGDRPRALQDGYFAALATHAVACHGAITQVHPM